MARQITFEKILDTLNELTRKIGESSDDCLEKRYGSDDEVEVFLLKVREKKYGHINDLLYEIINIVEEWLQI